MQISLQYSIISNDVWKLWTVFFIFLCNEISLFNACPPQLLFLWHHVVLGYLWFWGMQKQTSSWSLLRRLRNMEKSWRPQALPKIWMIDGGVRSLWSERWRMKGVVRTAPDQASAASGIKLVLPAQTPSWTSAVLWGGSWWRDFGLSWAQLNQLLVFHDPKNSCVKQA